MSPHRLFVREPSRGRGLLALLFLVALAQGTDLSAQNGLQIYQIQVGDHQGRLSAIATPSPGAKIRLYARFNAPPTSNLYDAVSSTLPNGNQQILIDGGTTPAIRTGRWFIGVKAPGGPGSFTIGLSASGVASSRPGMGASFYRGPGIDEFGTTFRVWAPNATQVRVAGDFNGWSSTLATLTSEGNGNWSMDYRNVRPGLRYRYVLQTPAGTLWKNDPRAQAVTNSVGNSIIVDHDAFSWRPLSYTTPAWNEMVVYEMHVGTFNDQPGGGPGTFTTAVERLPYLADLGINVIELMPVGEFPGDFSWGYNTSHPFAVETAYGGELGLKRFVDAAHAHGIAVVLDVLYNHWGPTDLDLWQFDGWNQGGWGGIYFYQDTRAQTSWGDTRPDFGRGEVRSYIRDNVVSWLQNYRLDGLRWDSTSNIRMSPWGNNPDGWSLMQWANDEVDAIAPWKISIAEDLYNAPNDWITKTTGAGGAGFDAQWDAIFVHPVREALVNPDDNARNMWAVANSIGQRYNTDAFERVIYTESHDEVANGRSRVAEEIWPGNAGSWYSKKRSTLGAALVMTSPGIPMLFQGQEILENGYFSDTDPVNWSLLASYSGIRDLYRELIRLRRNVTGTTRGLLGQSLNIHHVNDGDKVVAFHRWDQGGAGDDVIVVANFRNASWTNYRIGLPRPGQWHVRFNSDANVFDPTFGNHPSGTVTAQNIPWDGMSFSAELSFGPYTAIILSQ